MMILVALFVLVTASCALGGSTVVYDDGAALCAAPTYGIITDENFKTVGLAPGGAAEKAGLQVGDVLLDMTWIKMAPQTPCYGTITIGPTG